MDKPIDLIERAALEVARSLDIVVYAVDGLFERAVRDNPTPQGLGQFYRSAGQIMESAIETTMAKMLKGYDALERTLTLPERESYAAQSDSAINTGDAQAAFWGAFQQVRAQYVKRMREIIMARAFGTDTFSVNPKVMVRNGRRWNFTEFAYLTARGMLISRYNDAKIAHMASLGVKEFYLDTEDAALADQVFKVADYPDMAPEYFHPRTSNLVGVAHVST